MKYLTFSEGQLLVSIVTDTHKYVKGVKSNAQLSNHNELI